MGGADKGLVDFRGRPLVAHVIERLAPQVDRLLISANRNLDVYQSFGYSVLPDASTDRQGPLAGLQAGLHACPTDWLLCCPCDCPFLPRDLCSRLKAAIGTNSKMAIATTPTGMHPTFMLCRRDVLPALETALACGRLKLRDWCYSQSATEVMFVDESAFCNFNTADDLLAGSR